MSLAGTLTKLQKKGVELYVEISEFFSENSLIRTTWVEMARDLELQTESLKSLPSSFWNRLKADEATLNSAVELCANPEFGRKSDNRKLSYCFARTLDFEEPLILRAYVPLIRVLRTEWTDQALEFYIMVKAHVARLIRMIEPFADDPLLIRRTHDLLARFEHEVQEPVAAHQAKPLHAATPVVHSKAARSPQSRRQPAENAAHARSQRKNERVGPAKPLVKKIELPRRRARR